MSVIKQRASELNVALELSEKATEHLLSCLSKEPDHLGVRLSVKKTGCSGYSYQVDFVKKSEEGDLQMPLSGDYRIFVDKDSYPKLKNLRIDYVKQGLNSKLTFENPNQTGQCGCGESFTV